MSSDSCQFAETSKDFLCLNTESISFQQTKQVTLPSTTSTNPFLQSAPRKVQNIVDFRVSKIRNDEENKCISDTITILVDHCLKKIS